MDEERVLRLCMQTGLLLLRYGGETSRVEETMAHMAMGAGAPPDSVQSFVTPTGIFISMTTDNGTLTHLTRVTGPATMNLEKVTLLNDLSRRLQRGNCTVDEAFAELDRIEQAPFIYPRWMQMVASALSSGSFTIILGGAGSDFLWGAVGGLIAQETTRWLTRYAPRFFSVLLASLLGALLAVLSSAIGYTHDEGAIIIGAILPLLPGLAVTNAIRDLLAGDLLAGVARGAEALFTSVAIAIAVAVAIGISPRLT
ncbi:threonine/serine exporter family protein [Sulfoacidibacillus thermotolerans]|uniref:threonine/serine exporter family protein n=1 Tax=Sulfoacidibacillus thermotolerans TaxID=1765684 RepID=UPI0015E80907|nr:threonine/serine exporter family protein [Sulfoacidibacillus thermotolerans]